MKTSLLGQIWAWVKWPLMVLMLLLIAFFIWSLNLGRNKVLTDQAVAKIHANRLVWSDINGELPTQPDPTENNKTLAGVDANKNGIRDDVEVAIYDAHQNNWKVAIAELQYAKELQMEFTQVFNSDTLVAVLQEESRGSVCILNNSLADEVEKWVFNTPVRENAREDIYGKYMKGYALPNGNYCDIDSSTFKK